MMREDHLVILGSKSEKYESFFLLFPIRQTLSAESTASVEMSTTQKKINRLTFPEIIHSLSLGFPPLLVTLLPSHPDRGSLSAGFLPSRMYSRQLVGQTARPPNPIPTL